MNEHYVFYIIAISCLIIELGVSLENIFFRIPGSLENDVLLSRNFDCIIYEKYLKLF